MKLLDFLIDVLVIAIRWGGSVTSWIRSPFHNKKVGGHPKSRHLYGEAVDLVFDTIEGKKNAIEQFQRKGYHVLDEKDHVHVQIKRPEI